MCPDLMVISLLKMGIHLMKQLFIKTSIKIEWKANIVLSVNEMQQEFDHILVLSRCNLKDVNTSLVDVAKETDTVLGKQLLTGVALICVTDGIGRIYWWVF